MKLSDALSAMVQVACDTGEAPPLALLEEAKKRAFTLEAEGDWLRAAQETVVAEMDVFVQELDQDECADYGTYSELHDTISLWSKALEDAANDVASDDDRVTLMIRLHPDEHEELEQAAQAAGRDATAQAELLLRNHLPGTPDRLLARTKGEN